MQIFETAPVFSQHTPATRELSYLNINSSKSGALVSEYRRVSYVSCTPDILIYIYIPDCYSVVKMSLISLIRL